MLFVMESVVHPLTIPCTVFASWASPVAVMRTVGVGSWSSVTPQRHSPALLLPHAPPLFRPGALQAAQPLLDANTQQDRLCTHPMRQPPLTSYPHPNFASPTPTPSGPAGAAACRSAPLATSRSGAPCWSLEGPHIPWYPYPYPCCALGHARAHHAPHWHP